MRSVLVTGGNGHLGYNLIQLLIEEGYQVRATIRNLNNSKKISPFKNIDHLLLYEADITNRESLKKAIQGVDGVFHVAAPNLPWTSNPEQEIVEPILKGTKNVIELSREYGVKKVVFTSSCSSIGMDAIGCQPLTELNWNISPITPLIRSKLEAERWALDYGLNTQLPIVSICPPSIVGPGFFRHTPGTLFYEKILSGRLPPMPEGGCHLVDVRDLAWAHLAAYEKEHSSNRYIVAGEYFTFSQFFLFLKKLVPDLKLKQYSLPKWSLQGFRLLDWMNHRFTGRPRQITGDLIREFIGKYQKVSTAKAIQELGWKPRPTADTVLDTFRWIEEMILVDQPSFVNLHSFNYK